MDSEAIMVARWNNLKVLMQGCMKRGDFVLASGKAAKVYFDARMITMKAYGMRLVGDVITDFLVSLYHIGDEKEKVPTAVGGPALGALPLAVSVSMRAMEKHHIAYDVFVVRKKPKAHGTGELIEGPGLDSESQVVLLEDVTTTGSSLLAAAAAVRQTEASILCAITLLDREEGARKNLADAGITLIPMYTASEFTVTERENLI